MPLLNRALSSLYNWHWLPTLLLTLCAFVVRLFFIADLLILLHYPASINWWWLVDWPRARVCVRAFPATPLVGCSADL